MAKKGVRGVGARDEGAEFITNADLVLAVNELLGGITLDVASSSVANQYVGAENYYTPTDDALNSQQWYGSCYLFPPAGSYFWDQKNERWKMTRASSLTLTSSHAVWFRRMYHAWIAKEIKEGLYFSNCPDMIRYEPKIFKFPMCILRSAPYVLCHKDGEISKKKTCTSFFVYLPPQDSPIDSVDTFAKIYGERGHLLV
jgi:hypothetical protein